MILTSTGVASAALDLTAVATATAVTVQLTKFLLEKVVTPADPNHDSYIRLYTIAVAVAVALFQSFVISPLHSPHDILLVVKQALGIGATAGLTAVGGYHILNPGSPQTPPPIGSAFVPPSPVVATTKSDPLAP